MKMKYDYKSEFSKKNILINGASNGVWFIIRIFFLKSECKCYINILRWKIYEKIVRKT